MSAYNQWKKDCRNWTSGHSSDNTVLRKTAAYLHESANWIEVRDFLISMGMTRQQCLNWFSEQDFSDFAEAVDEGWGWPETEDA